MKPGNGAISAAEIEEAVWISGLEACELELAPLAREVIMPLLRRDFLFDRTTPSQTHFVGWKAG